MILISATILNANSLFAQTNPAAVTAPPTEKVVEIPTAASNGDKFDKFVQKHGDKSLDEAENLVDTKKWTEKDYDNFVRYEDQKRKAQMVLLNQVLAQKKEAAIKEAWDWWQKTQPLLSSLPQEKVIWFLRADTNGNKKLLQFIVDNNLPPPGYAERLLQMLE